MKRIRTSVYVFGSKTNIIRNQKKRRYKSTRNKINFLITPITQPRLNNAKCIKIELILILFLLLRHILTRNT